MSKKSTVVVNASLKDIYKQLRPPLISAKVFEDLSICIAFQILLFLANEHVSFEYYKIFFFLRAILHLTFVYFKRALYLKMTRLAQMLSFKMPIDLLALKRLFLMILFLYFFYY